MSKTTSTHSTYIHSAKKILSFLNKHPNVSKVSLGIITPKKSMAKTVVKPKITLHDSHILLKINSKLANQKIRVYGKNLESLFEEMCSQ